MSALKAPRLGIDYLPHQEEGIRWMLSREAADAPLGRGGPSAELGGSTPPLCRGGILADDMGLGKTFQTIGLLKNTPHDLKTLIICPPALVAGWTEELIACGFAVRLLGSSGNWTSPSAVAVRLGHISIYLTTYPKICLYREFLEKDAFGRVILDEGHIIRNGVKTARGDAVRIAASKASCRWILSATPVQNGYADWRNLCRWLGVPDAEIPTASETIMLRRTMEELRGDVAALPPPARFYTHDLTIPATGATAAEGKLLRALCHSLKSVIDSRAVSALMKLELYLRIQQMLVHPQIYIESMRTKFKGSYPRPDWTDTATKWTAVMAELRTGIADGKSQIVFCNFRAEMDRLVAETTVMGGAAVFCIRGGMGVDAVGETVAAARAAAVDGPVVVVVQIVSGGAGLNLQFCSRVLFMSQHWNPAVVHQAVGRAVRIGQRAVVEVHMFRVVDDMFDNLDRRMVAVHLMKIRKAQDICETLYDGYAPITEIPSAGLEAFEGEGEGDDASDVGSVVTIPPPADESDDDDPR